MPHVQHSQRWPNVLVTSLLQTILRFMLEICHIHDRGLVARLSAQLVLTQEPPIGGRALGRQREVVAACSAATLGGVG